jgi:spore maturation protein CgeB
MLLNLLKAGFEVDVYGHGWKRTRLAIRKNIRIHEAVYGQAYWNKLRQYRVQLNIFRKHNLGSHNMRTFEIPAVGGIQLTPFSEEQAGFFEENKEIFFYRDIGELEDKCRYLLDLPGKEVNAIREAARRRSATSGYTYRDRSLLVYNTFKSAFEW